MDVSIRISRDLGKGNPSIGVSTRLGRLKRTSNLQILSGVIKSYSYGLNKVREA